MTSLLEFNKLNKTTTFTRAPPSSHSNKWTTQQTQQIYATNLIQALRHSPPSTASSYTVDGKQVRETADRILAVSGKGTMRWSKAILSGPRSAGAQIMKKHKKAKVISNRRLRRSAIKKDKRNLTVVKRKLKVLGRIVPGCRKLSYSNILDETSDYIAALEMQVRAMTAITQFVASDGNGEGQPPANRIGSNVFDL